MKMKLLLVSSIPDGGKNIVQAITIYRKEISIKGIPSYFNLYTPSASHINVRYNDKTAIRKGN